MESSGGTVRPHSYAEAAAATPTRSTDFPTLEKQPRRQRQKESRKKRKNRTRPRKAPARTASSQRGDATPRPNHECNSRPKFTVFVSAPCGQGQEEVSSTAAAERTKLMESVNPARDGIRVRNMRQTTGGKVVLEVQTAGDLEKLKTHQGLKASGLQLAPPTFKSPRVIIYDVPKDISAEGKPGGERHCMARFPGSLRTKTTAQEGRGHLPLDGLRLLGGQRQTPSGTTDLCLVVSMPGATNARIMAM